MKTADLIAGLHHQRLIIDNLALDLENIIKKFDEEPESIDDFVEVVERAVESMQEWDEETADLIDEVEDIEDNWETSDAQTAGYLGQFGSPVQQSWAQEFLETHSSYRS